jgi:hypothetical protein
MDYSVIGVMTPSCIYRKEKERERETERIPTSQLSQKSVPDAQRLKGKRQSFKSFRKKYKSISP